MTTVHKNALTPLYVVIGTRAQLVKTAPVMREMEIKRIPYRFIYTAQHRETIDDIRNNFGIKGPDYVLESGEEAKTLFLFGKWLLLAVNALIFKKKEMVPNPGLLITHGDTATSLWGALLGKLTGCRVIHLESGLRSFSLFKPFPEEIIRLLTFRFTDVYICPNNLALGNVEKYTGEKLITERNTLYDAVKLAVQNEDKTFVDIPAVKYAVVSIHRFENIFDRKRLSKIVAILTEISQTNHLIFIMHPPTAKQLKKLGYEEALRKGGNISLRERLPFFEFIKLVNHSEFVITDGGSNQEELSYLGKPSLILREVTERCEGLNENALLSGLDKRIIWDFIGNYPKYRRIPQLDDSISPSRKVVDFIAKELHGRT